MKGTLTLLASVLALANGVSAHYRWYRLILNGVATGEYQYVRRNTNINSPVENVNSLDIRCNAGGLASGPATEVANVTAGSTVGFLLDYRLIHPGPISVMMSRSSGDVRNYDGSGTWFKIDEVGAVITPTAITWPADQRTQHTFQIPPTTPPGQYLLRIEHIGLHSASNLNGAQFYISCAQINVSGPGGGNPGPTIRLPGGYSPTESGIQINIYWPTPTSYKVPGPAVWRG